MKKPLTKGDTVFIPTFDEQTGESQGEATVDVADGDLAAHQPWYVDESGVYAVVRVLGRDFQVYMHDLVGARVSGGRVLGSGLLLSDEQAMILGIDRSDSMAIMDYQ